MAKIPMPKLSMNMVDGLVLDWLVEDGEHVTAGTDLVEIESEKSTAVVEAPADGRVHIKVEEGETVAVGTTLAMVGDEVTSDTADETGQVSEEPPEFDDGREEQHVEPEEIPQPSETSRSPDASPASPEASSADAQSSNSSPKVHPTPSARRAAREANVSVDDVAQARDTRRVSIDDVMAHTATSGTHDEEAAPPEQSRSKVRASPAARHASREHDVDIRSVNGSGPNGAIVVADVETLVRDRETAQVEVSPESVSTQTPSTDVPTAVTAPVKDRQTLSGVRSVIAERLGRSWREAPHVTVNRVIEVDRTLAALTELDEALDVEISFSDLLIVTTAETLDRHPEFNATLVDDEYIRYDRVDLAIAVDTDRGLLSPVLRGVDDRSLPELASERRELVTATLEDRLDPDRVDGGTFTITNLGPLGVSSFTPIINPPQIGILGISTIRRAPRESDTGDVAFGDVMTASLSFDHRAVDGGDAARFLQTFADLLNRPLAVLVG